MASRTHSRNRIARRAAISLAACVILILSFTRIVMQSTVWNRAAMPALNLSIQPFPA